ncbi:DUF2851 family protein [Carboxylicivirga taeanensis]|uniref:DUF2851 family protein n=1 Tax=Carboxylicivirga taeanensis TaxID=1416875 RepID=UPI003F6DAEFA
MNEDFLHFIWKYKLYQPELFSTDGQPIQVIHPGIKNTDGGPDFFNAKIKIDGTLWAGNVEIHQSEHEWYQHQHHLDPGYNNVILHVVAKQNKHTINASNRKVTVCSLPIPQALEQRYQTLLTNDNWIACEEAISSVTPLTLNQWLDRLLIERLENKSELINELLASTKNNWDQVFFVLLARSFGFGVNGLPFEIMARQTPLSVLLKHSNSLFQVEALLFGQAGFLSKLSPPDAHIRDLKKEYDFLRSKYQLQPINSSMWKFLRLRPVNFPTIRIAQLASFICQTKGHFESLFTLNNTQNRLSTLQTEASAYWSTHYLPGKKSAKTERKTLGKQSKLRIIYNTIIPYLFIYYSKHSNEEQKEKIIDYLYQQPAEKNRIVNKWAELNLVAENEAQAQALLHLKYNYCNHKKCLNCRIGHEVLCKN